MLGKIESPLNELLDKVEWGEFRLGDLFVKIKTKSLSYKASELPSEPNCEYSLPALTAGIQNQGLNNYVPNKNATILKNVISISANGANTGATFYQNKEFTVLQDAYAIKWINDADRLSENMYLFLASAISKTIFGNYEWTNKAGWEKIKNNKITLPLNNDKIDFKFMEKVITQIEAEHISRINTYLESSGLMNCKLTKEQQHLLDNYSSIEWGEFKVGNLFEKAKTKKLDIKAEDLPKEKTGKYVLPCLTSSFRNQGLNYFVPKDGATILKNVISIPSNSDVYRAYFQSQSFTVLSDAYAIRYILDDAQLLPEQQLFAVSCINKVTNLPLYSYKNKLGGWNVVKDKYILLPIKEGKPDYEIMGKLISAIKKLAIKDVVAWATSNSVIKKYD